MVVAEVETKPHREKRAKRLEEQGRVRGRELGKVSKWHFSRAKGQRERFANVRNCQHTDVVRACCQACGYTTEEGARCRSPLLCVSCRGKIASQKRARFQRARAVAIKRAKRTGLSSETERAEHSPKSSSR